jgi:hypothetical protein
MILRLLERNEGNGTILVKYSNCNIEILNGCEVEGDYTHTPTERIQVTEFIYNLPDLFRYLPLDANKLAPKFVAGGLWSIDAVNLSFFQTPLESIGSDQLAPQCASATHYLSDARLGAYRLSSQIEKDSKKKKDTVRRGGVYERCLLSEEDSESAICREITRMRLEPIRNGAPLPPSSPHPLLGQLPGAVQSIRVEAMHMGRRLLVPSPGKVTIVVFWSAACAPCERVCPERDEGEKPSKKCRKELEACEKCSEKEVFEPALDILQGLQQHLESTAKHDFEIVGVASGIDDRWARRLLIEIDASFPMVIDDERGRLARRYHLKNQGPAVFVLDKDGKMQFFATGSSADTLKEIISSAKSLGSR